MYVYIYIYIELFCSFCFFVFRRQFTFHAEASKALLELRRSLAAKKARDSHRNLIKKPWFCIRVLYMDPYIFGGYRAQDSLIRLLGFRL